MFEIRTDDNITTMGHDVATPEDIFELHEWPESWTKNFPTGFPEVSGDEKLTVAVMDSGICSETAENHPWFANTEVTKRYDATGNDSTGDDLVGHGTGVASIIARATPEIEMYSLKIFSNQASTGRQTIRDAYQWLARNSDEIDLVNMSWGSSNDVPQINEYHEKIIDMGIIDIVAAGNSSGRGGSPSTAKNAFSAGALDEDGEPTRFSSWNPDKGNPEVAVIGKDVKVAKANRADLGKPLNEDFVKCSGTSFSAPYTAAAYINALYKEKVNWDGRFVRGAEDIPGTEKDGAGVLKLQETLKETSFGMNGHSQKSRAEASSWDFRGNDTLWIDADWLPSGDTSAELLDETKEYVDIRIEK